MKGVPDAIHHTDTSETLEYITGWNDCRAAMLEKLADHHDPIGDAQALLIAEQAAQAQQEPLTDILAKDLRGVDVKTVERFAELVRADEREACAKVCESQPMRQDIDVREQCAAAIRARSNT